MCKKNNFQISLLIAIEMAVLSAFLRKKGLGPIMVNRLLAFSLENLVLSF